MLNAKLVVVGGDAKVTEIQLNLPTCIGRSREAKLKLPHPLVSRQHCELFEREGQLFVRDLGSLNGTYIDNQKIEKEHALRPNQLLTLGNVTFRAVYEANSSVAAGDTAVADTSERPTQPAESSAPAGPHDLTVPVPAPETPGVPAVDATSDTPELGEIDFSEIGERETPVPQVASSIFVDTGGAQTGGSVSLSEISKLPGTPAHLSFAGGIEADESAKPKSPVVSSPPLVTDDRPSDDPRTAKRRPR
jgi:predicted component of type VI protein secretion system